MENKLYVNDGNFDTSNTMAYQLLVEVGKGFYAYCIVDEEGVINVISYNKGDIQLANDISLLQLPYKKTCISLPTSSFTFLPSQLYNKDDETKYAQFLETNNHTIINTCVFLNNEVTALYTFNSDELIFIRSLFPSSKIFPPYLPLINCVHKLLANDLSPQLTLNLKSEKLEILIFNNGKLLFYNVFDALNADEVLYYTLNACQQNKLISKEINVNICGDIFKNDAIYMQLAKYFGKISFMLNNNVKVLSTEFEDIVWHQYFSLLNLSTCE